ncbi:hypothetical protein HALTITAN_2352 [Vreelandella titanicae BH1]|uniref:Uncharacterized protein n=1 Tax=Vreelandella titanicae BH1 TaxID=1204738 RepID=L9U7G5_9GAMM|nr:hypothetical protein HALTITAN_2352 [Halomonas titanicae BH1]
MPLQNPPKGIDRLRRNSGNFDFSEPLAVALTLHVVLTTTELDDGDFIAAPVGNHFGRDFSTTDHRRTDVEVIAISDHQHFVKLNRFAGSDFDFLELEGLTFLNAVLLTTAFDNCVHVALRTVVNAVLTVKRHSSPTLFRVVLLSTCCEWRPFWSHLTGSKMSGSRIITTIFSYHKTIGYCQLTRPSPYNGIS